MNPKDELGVGENELQRPDFSKPVCWCESTAHFTNPQGQEFELRVRGGNSADVERYIENVRVSFEVGPAQDEPAAVEPPSVEQDDTYKSYIDEAFKKVELHHDLDLEIDMDILKVPELEPPYDLKVVIDPDIAGGATHTYKSRKQVRIIKVTLSASKNGVYGVLSGGGISAVTGQADTYPPEPPETKARFSGEAAAQADFYFSVTGLLATNKYTYSSSSRLDRL